MIMARNIQLNSSDWCDIVFTGKNKSYGAYALRQSSSKRHIWAFLVVVIFVGVVAGIPAFLKAVTPPKEYVQNVTDIYNIAELEKLKEQEEQILEPATMPAPPLVANAQRFTPPAITADNMVDETRELISQEEMNASNAIISTITVETGNTVGIDPRELQEHGEITNDPPQDPNKIFDVVTVMPQFPGGNGELMKYLSANIKYPTIAAENGIEGRVVLKFVVQKNGSISDIQVVRPLDPSCDKEAVRVVKGMPNWIPGMQNGHPVAVYFTLPVLFKLQR